MKRVIVSSDSTYLMNSESIMHNLKSLDNKLRENDMLGEIDMFGGAVMCLGLNARQSTHDIDAIFAPKTSMKKLISEVAEENNLSEDWINDGVKGFVSKNGEFYRFGADQFTNLTIFMTTPEYLLAMKCLSCRLSDEHELNDIKFLIDYLKLESVEAVEDLILQFYPESMFKPKTHYMLLELFDA